MRSSYQVEQVFVRPKGGQLEVEVVLVALSGALKHDAMSFATRNEGDAVRRAARHLASRGDVESAEKARLRVARGASLVDDAALRRIFRHTFAVIVDDGL